MTNSQILKKAIIKATKNGFNVKLMGGKGEWKWIDIDLYALEVCNRIPSIIFSHSFAINFYGKNWKKRLQEQVLEVNPLDYIRKYLD